MINSSKKITYHIVWRLVIMKQLTSTKKKSHIMILLVFLLRFSHHGESLMIWVLCLLVSVTVNKLTSLGLGLSSYSSCLLHMDVVRAGGWEDARNWLLWSNHGVPETELGDSPRSLLELSHSNPPCKANRLQSWLSLGHVMSWWNRDLKTNLSAPTALALHHFTLLMSHLTQCTQNHSENLKLFYCYHPLLRSKSKRIP